jgi:hypothetical protein
MRITLIEYAQRVGRDPSRVRRKAMNGDFKTAQKVGRDWTIDEDEPYTDRRKGLTPEQIARLGAAYAKLAWAMRQHKGSAAANPLERPAALQKASISPVAGLSQALLSLYANRALSGQPRLRKYVDQVMMEAFADIDPEDVPARISLQDTNSWWLGYYADRRKAEAQEGVISEGKEPEDRETT